MSAVRRILPVSCAGETPGANPPTGILRSTPSTMHTDVEIPQVLPSGTIPEEERAAQLFTADLGPKKDLGPARYGKGPRPCFCCGKDGHSWIACPKKVSGKCGVCGSQEHPTFRCHKRFQPSPESRVNCVVSFPADEVPAGVRTLDQADLPSCPRPMRQRMRTKTRKTWPVTRLLPVIIYGQQSPRNLRLPTSLIPTSVP